MGSLGTLWHHSSAYILKIMEIGIHHRISHDGNRSKYQISAFHLVSVISYKHLTLFVVFWVNREHCYDTGESKFWKFCDFDYTIEFVTTEVVWMPNFTFSFGFLEKLLAFDPFWVFWVFAEHCDVTSGSKSLKYCDFDSSMELPTTKVV